MKLEETQWIRLLCSLNKEETKQFDRFLQSPLHNTHEDTYSLFKAVRAYLPEKTNLLTKEKLYKKIYASKKYDDLKFRHLVSYLHARTKEFITLNESHKINAWEELQLIKSLNNRGLDIQFNAALRKSRERFAWGPKVEVLYFDHLIEQEAFNFEARKGRIAVESLPSLTASFDQLVIITKLKHYCLVMNHHKLFDQEVHIAFLDEAERMIESGKLDEIPIINLHYRVYLMLKFNEDTDQYFEVKKVLGLYKDELHSEELEEVLRHAVNYCIRKINLGKGDFLRELLSLYQFGLEHELLVFQGKLFPFTYKNIVSASIRLKELDWARQFVADYSRRLHSNLGGDFYAINMAKINFEQGRYSEVVDYVLNIRYKDTLTELSSRLVLLKAYYEMDAYELLDTMTENFRKLISRRKIKSYHARNYINFIKLLRKLSSINFHNKDAVADLKHKIQSESQLPEKSWLLQKIDLL